MKKYRQRGVGRKIAFQLFDRFHGVWKIAQNTPAQAFWRKIISEYTNGNYEEIREPGWNGPIQIFRAENNRR
jgi:predicted acetyltransferase